MDLEAPEVQEVQEALAISFLKQEEEEEDKMLDQENRIIHLNFSLIKDKLKLILLHKQLSIK